MPAMSLVEGLDTALQGASGTWYPGTVTMIDDLANLPVGATGTGFDETIAWEIPPEVTQTTGTFCVAEFTLPSVWEIMPEPGSLTLLLLGLGLLLRQRSR